MARKPTQGDVFFKRAKASTKGQSKAKRYNRPKRSKRTGRFVRG